MNKFFSFKNKNENLSPDELEKKNKLKLLLYLVFIIILIVIMRLSNLSTTANNIDESDYEEKDKIIELMESLKMNNYEVDIELVVDNDLVRIVRRMQDADTEIFYIKYRGEENTYFRNQTDYYILDGEEITKTTEYTKLFDYDETFINPTNLIKLLENNNESYLDLTEEKYEIRRYKIALNNVLSIYNEINSTNEFTSLNNEISIDVRYKDSLDSIYMNLTHFNNYILNTNFTKVTYEMNFSDINKIDLNYLVENLNNME